MVCKICKAPIEGEIHSSYHTEETGHDKFEDIDDYDTHFTKGALRGGKKF